MKKLIAFFIFVFALNALAIPPRPPELIQKPIKEKTTKK